MSDLLLLVDAIPMYFARLPDDEREPAKMVFATFAAHPNGEHVRFLRGVWDVDTWEKWSTHRHFERPCRLLVQVREESPGVVLHVSALVPLRELPREQWPDEDGEEWKGEQVPPPQARGPLPLGVLVRYAARRRYPRDLVREAHDILSRALYGGTVEPYEQGLAL